MQRQLELFAPRTEVVPGPLPDAAVRARIEADLGTNLLVEAGAGAGKTTELVNRMVALVRSGHTTVDRIAAVTFTRKAASELRERFQTLLESELTRAHEAGRSAASGVAPGRGDADPEHSTQWHDEVARLDRALREIDRAFIGTIHAFCARLLRARPLDAGLDPGFREVQTSEEIVLRRKFYDRHVERLAADGDPVLARLDEVGLTTAQLFDVYTEIAANPDVDFRTVQAPRPDAARARAALEVLLDAAQALMPGEEPVKGWDQLQTAVRTLTFYRRVLDWNDDTHFLNVMAETLSSTPDVIQSRWSDDKPGKAAAKKLGARFREFCEQGGIGEVTIGAWLEHRHPVAIEFARSAAASFQDERIRAGSLLFSDLLMRAAHLLRTRPGARRELGDRYRYILVDEFQDTDPIQAEILFLLASDANAADWRAAVPRPGALFVVGDPKQSIYRFRRADIALYESVKRRFESFGDVIELTTNFRSTPPIGRFVNDVFESLFPSTSSDQQARFAPMRTARPDAAAQGVFWYRLAPPSGRSHWKRAAEFAQQEADRLATWIKRRIDNGERQPGDFLVLTRRNAFIPTYAQAIEARSVPVQVTGGGVTIQTELAELRLLLSALADPGDERLTVAVLVGLFFGLDYEQLVEHVVDRGGSLSLLTPIARPQTAVERALHTMHEFWQLSRREPADIVISRIVNDLGLLPFAAAGELGDSRAGALLYVLDAARYAATSGDASVGGILAALDAAVAAEEAEAQLEPGRSDVVRVMNLHQAKGLEAAVVILAEPNMGRLPAPTRYVDRSHDPAHGYAVATEPRRFGGHNVLARPVGWAGFEATEQAFEDAERNRLLYVAATRAADELIVSCTDEASKSPWGGFSPYIEKCAHLQLELAGAPAPAAPTVSGQDIVKEVEAIDHARSLLAVPTYDARSVTRRLVQLPAGVAKADRPGSEIRALSERSAPDRQRPDEQRDLAYPRGADWGSAVHQVLEAAGRGASAHELRLLAHAALLANDRPMDPDGEPQELDELLQAVEATRLARFWPSVERARERGRLLIEVPFAVRLSAQDYGAIASRLVDTQLAGPEAVQVVEGVIDLAYRDDDGWTIVDYKSDAAGRATDSRRRARYRAQIGLYAAAWARIAGEPVKERIVFYTADGTVDAW